MTVHLLPIPVADLRVLAESGTPRGVASRAAEGALPPRFVAARSLRQLQEGGAARWCSTFYIVRSEDHWVVGGCGFKDAPASGRVEIGYAVSPSCRNRGFATAAVLELLRLAFASEEVSEVVAEVGPANLSSARVVEKLGFERGATTAGESREEVVQWILRRPHT